MNTQQPSAPPPGPLNWVRYRRRVVLLFGVSLLAMYGVILGYHLLTPRTSSASTNLLEQCRELCLQYGLVPTGHIANDAKAYLNFVREEELSAPLREILADNKFVVAESKPHDLLKRPAPDFRLENHRGEPVSLSDLTRGGPVVLVFYYGYGCPHCVAQLFGLHEDIALFNELGAKVVAVSADPPAQTRDRFAEYGEFAFPVLSDPENKVAEQYGVFRPAEGDLPEDLRHGTFVVSPGGKVVFATYGYQPFVDNKSLLYMLSEFARRPAADGSL